MDPDAEEGMARNDSTISLHGFTERVKFQAAWLGQSEKLEQQKERLLQEQRRLQDEQEALVEKLEVVNCQFNSGIMNDLAEGVDNSFIVPTNPPVSAGEGLASETSSSAPAANSANAESADEQMEAEFVHP